MIISNLVNLVTPTWTRPELVEGYSVQVPSGQSVNQESTKRLATAYRCANILSDDIAQTPLQEFDGSDPNDTKRVMPNGLIRNMAYVVEVQPNRFRNQTPFLFKKQAINWLLFDGNTYIWNPPSRWKEIFILPSNLVTPYIDLSGQLKYDVILDTQTWTLPDVEVLHLMINSKNGLKGRGVLTYARETFGRRMAANTTQDNLYKKGLRPAAVISMAGELNKEAREKVRTAYSEAIAGSENAGNLAVIDQKVLKFDVVQMNMVDAQFLQLIEATDTDICNFFGLPIYKLNQGKQSYESNDQQKLDYMDTTLNPYYVAWEQAAKLQWLTALEQINCYWRFERNVHLSTDAKTRGEILKNAILSARISPNQANRIEDLPAYQGGDRRYIPSNMAAIEPDGTITILAAPKTGAEEEVNGK